MIRRMARREGELAAAGAAVIFGTAWVATGIALRSYTPVAAAFWRGAMAALLMAAIVGVQLARGRADLRGAGRRSIGRIAILGLLGGPIFALAMNYAIADAGATIAAFVAGAYPVIAATLAPVVLREPLSRGAAAGFVLALAGAILLTELDLARAPVGGIAVGAVGAVAVACYLVLLRRWGGGPQPDPLLTPELSATAVGVLTAAVLLPIELLAEPAALMPASPGLAPLLAVVWLAIGPGCLSQILLAMSARRIPARRSAAFLLLNPVTAAIAAPILLGEFLSPIQGLGAVLVTLGIGLAATR